MKKIELLTWPHRFIVFIVAICKGQIFTRHSGYFLLYKTPCNNQLQTDPDCKYYLKLSCITELHIT